MANVPFISSFVGVVVVVILSTQGVNPSLMDRPEGLPQGQIRSIPPFSPSLEIARSMGSSPVTPRGRDVGIETPRTAKTTTAMEDVDDSAAGSSGDENPDLYERGAAYERTQDSESHMDEGLDDMALEDEEDEEDEEEVEEVCPPRLPDHYITWRRKNRVVRVALPHQVLSACSPPLKCSVTTIVHRRVLLQDGDTLEVVLQTPPDYNAPSDPPPTTTTTTTTTTKNPETTPATTTTTTTTTTKPSPPPTATTTTTAATTTTTTSPATTRTTTPTTTTTTTITTSTTTTTITHEPTPKFPTSKSTPLLLHPSLTPPPTRKPTHGPSHAHPIANHTHIFSRVDHPAHPSAPIRKREVSVGQEENTTLGLNVASPPLQRVHLSSNQTSMSPLTLWKASLSEWATCSTREGSQVGESGPEGVITITPGQLQAGSNYFIGRSSWSSTECFKLQVTVRSAECGEGSLCSGKGVCYTNPKYMEHFQCKCCEGYTGSHCEEMNACSGEPCLNAGICVDIQEGHDGDTFQCLCPYGYRGRLCEEKTNQCESGPCRNGAVCTGNHSSYTCHCPAGWTGKQCRESVSVTTSENDMVRCQSHPCKHGVCVETTEQTARCFCQPGFGGKRCEFEYNECDSSPCVNGGTCVDQIGGYACLCGRGYTGTHCEIKFDLCSPNPCPSNLICVDKGNSYSCDCLRGFTEDNCGPHPQLCVPNPCDNGGTCWNLPDANVFYCACRAGFTGTTCQGILQEAHDEAVPETVGVVGTMESAPLESHQQMNIPFSHMKNLYVAIATLAAALLIFIVVVGVCHCRVNRTYKKFLVKLPRPHKVMPTVKRPRPTSLFDKPRFVRNWRNDRAGNMRLDAESDGALMPMTASNSDAVYYNMDVCDNQELPLIK